MSGAYFDCVLWKETKNGKKFAVKIGSAKQRDDQGFNVYLDALPTGDGSFTIVPQRDRGRASPQGAAGLDDEIPF